MNKKILSVVLAISAVVLVVAIIMNSVEITGKVTATASAPLTYDDLALNLNFEDGIVDISNYHRMIFTNGSIGVVEDSDPARGKVLQLDGKDDYLEIADDNSLDFSKDDDFTISYWFNPPTDSKLTPKIEYPLVYKYVSGKTSAGYKSEIEVVKGGGYQISATLGITALHAFIVSDSWNHVVILKNSTGAYMYINGMYATGSKKSINVNLANSAPLFIGSDGTKDGNKFKGSLDNIMIFRKALSEEEIAALYNNSYEGMYGPPLILKVEAAEKSPKNHLADPDSSSFATDKMLLLKIDAPEDNTDINSITLLTQGNGNDTNVDTVNIYTSDSAGTPKDLISTTELPFEKENDAFNIIELNYRIISKDVPTYLLITYNLSKTYVKDDEVYSFLVVGLDSSRATPETLLACKPLSGGDEIVDGNGIPLYQCGSKSPADTEYQKYCDAQSARMGIAKCCLYCDDERKNCHGCSDEIDLSAVTKKTSSRDSSRPAGGDTRTIEVQGLPVNSANMTIKFGSSIPPPTTMNCTGNKTNESWSECSDGLRYRTTYFCNTTNGTWVAVYENESCESEEPFTIHMGDDETGGNGNSGESSTTTTETKEEGMPTWLLILIIVGGIVLLGGGGFAVYWFGFRKKPSFGLPPPRPPASQPPISNRPKVTPPASIGGQQKAASPAPKKAAPEEELNSYLKSKEEKI